MKPGSTGDRGVDAGVMKMVDVEVIAGLKMLGVFVVGSALFDVV